ncbi:MAG: M67 family metallopeptidase [Proteobacteria bacterium]|nr:M67 family metallopeptidase [Pseudomonadota bacterium]
MKIPREVVSAIYRQARAEAPLEACGYLAGRNGTVAKHYRLTNMDQSEEHFSFDPKEQFAVIKSAREEQLDLIAVYHSHPETPARPSAEDIRLAYDPDISYVIVSLANNGDDIKSFKISDGNVTPEILEIT